MNGRIQAYNPAGGTFSDPLTRHSLANPPINSLITAVGERSISLDWAENGNTGTPVYEVQYSADPLFSTATTVSPTGMPSLRREASRSGSIGIWSASGWPQ